MAIAYFACFDVADSFNALGSVTCKATGKPDVVIDLTAIAANDEFSVSTSVFNWFWYALQTDGGDKKASQHNGSFPTKHWGKALSDALSAEATSQGWAGTLTAGCDIYSFSLGTAAAPFCYFIADSQTLTNINFSTAGGAALFGFSANWTGTALNTAVFGTYVPNFVIVPTLTSVSAVAGNDAKDYEPDQISTQAITDTGAVHGMARTISPLYRDWVQQYETKAKTVRLSATADHPYTFQAMIEDSRTYWPFVVFDGFGYGNTRPAEVFFFRPEGAHFGKDTVQRASEANDAQFHITHLTVSVGTPGASWSGGGS